MQKTFKLLCWKVSNVLKEWSKTEEENDDAISKVYLIDDENKEGFSFFVPEQLSSKKKFILEGCND